MSCKAWRGGDEGVAHSRAALPIETRFQPLAVNYWIVGILGRIHLSMLVPVQAEVGWWHCGCGRLRASNKNGEPMRG